MVAARRVNAVCSLVPLDLETILASVGKTRRLVVAHSSTAFSGFGGSAMNGRFARALT